jgi:hypothetical protein
MQAINSMSTIRNALVCTAVRLHCVAEVLLMALSIL